MDSIGNLLGYSQLLVAGMVTANLRDILSFIQINSLEHILFTKTILVASFQEIANIFHLFKCHFTCIYFRHWIRLQYVNQTVKWEKHISEIYTHNVRLGTSAIRFSLLLKLETENMQMYSWIEVYAYNINLYVSRHQTAGNIIIYLLDFSNFIDHMS